MPRPTKQRRVPPYNPITAAMRERGYTNAYVAEVVGITRQNLAYFRTRGYYESLRTPKALADVLGLTLEDLAPPDGQ